MTLIIMIEKYALRVNNYVLCITKKSTPNMPKLYRVTRLFWWHIITFKVSEYDEYQKQESESNFNKLYKQLKEL